MRSGSHTPEKKRGRPGGKKEEEGRSTKPSKKWVDPRAAARFLRGGLTEPRPLLAASGGAGSGGAGAEGGGGWGRGGGSTSRQQAPGKLVQLAR